MLGRWGYQAIKKIARNSNLKMISMEGAVHDSGDDEHYGSNITCRGQSGKDDTESSRCSRRDEGIVGKMARLVPCTSYLDHRYYTASYSESGRCPLRTQSPLIVH